MQSLDKLPIDVLKIVMVKALMWLSVHDQPIIKHFTTLASLSPACHVAIADSDIRHFIKQGGKKMTLTLYFLIDNDEN